MTSYPDAKVVLVEHDVEDWYRSFSSTVIQLILSRRGDLFVDYIEHLVGSRLGATGRTALYAFFNAGDADEMARKARSVYREHYRRVRETVPRERLLKYRLGEGMGPLCGFLGKDVPPEDLSFPRVNEAAALKAKVREMRWRVLKRAAAAGVVLGWWYLIPIVVVIVVVGLDVAMR